MGLTVDEQLVPTLLGVKRHNRDLAEIGPDGATFVIAVVAGVVGAGDAISIQNAWPLD